MSEPSAEAVIKAYGIVGENTVMLSNVLGNSVVRVSSLCDAIARAIGPKRPGRPQLLSAANALDGTIGEKIPGNLDGPTLAAFISNERANGMAVAAFLRELAEENE